MLLYLKQRPSLIRYSYLEDSSKVYPRVLVLISIALGCLGQDNNLVDIYRAIILYYRAGFSIRRSILLYRLLITFM